MKSISDDLIAIMQSNEYFSPCSAIDLTKLLPYIEYRKLGRGESLYRRGEPCSHITLVIEGSISIARDGKLHDEVVRGFVGEESLVGNQEYIADATASSPSLVLSIQREHLNVLLDSYPQMKSAMISAFYSHYTSGITGSSAASSKKAAAARDGGPSRSIIAGWILSILLPVVVYIICDLFNFSWKTKIFLTIFTPTIIMWVFRLTHEFIPSILAILVILILDIAPPSVALSGFASGSFFMALSVFGISTVLITSGLTYRIVINILRYIPQSQFWYSFALIITGLFLTPLFPAANGRIVLATPIYLDLIDALGYRPGGKAATRLGAATFSGFTLFSGIFLSSKSIHFVIFGLLSFQVREQFNWGYWFFASLVAGAVLLGGQILLENLMFKNDEKPHLSKEKIEAQHALLGKLTSHEWSALGGIFLFLMGIATSSIHKIDLSWVGLTVLYVILAHEFLTKKEFQGSIDWSFLIYLATLLGLVKTMSYIGLDAEIGKHLLWLGEYISTNFLAFILLASCAILLLRLFIPNNATVIILASVCLPVAELCGINTWVIGFIILMISDAWFLPYQCTYYTQFEELTENKKAFDKKAMLTFNAFTVLLRLAAIYASIPYWRLLGIL